MSERTTKVIDLPDDRRVIFRPADGMPRMMDHIHWQAELHVPSAGCMGELPYPVALAWITDFPAGGPTDLPPVLDFVLVPDPFRRRGHATRLIKECERRWPGLELTDAISPEGEALLDSLEKSR